MFRAVRLAVAATALWASSAAAQTVFDIPQARALAFQLETAGQPSAALAIALKLLERDPRDAAALIAVSRSERDLGHYDRAFDAAQAAYAFAETDALRHYAALAAAQALASDEKRLLAQIWLRRAAEYAPDAVTAARVARDYAYLRDRMRWSVDPRFALAPSDNVNNGPTSPDIQIGGLIFTDPSAQPISGLEISAGATLSYRLAETTTRRASLRLGYDDTQIVLGPEAASIDPTLRAAAMRQQSADLGLSYDFAPQPDRMLSLSAHRTGFWSGGIKLVDINGLGIAGTFAPHQGQSLVARANIDWHDRADSALRDATVRVFSLDYSRRLSAGQRLAYGISYKDTDSASASIAAREVSAHLEIGLPPLIDGLSLELGLEAGARLFDQPLFTPEPRQDQFAHIGLTAVWSGGTHFGLVPVIELGFDRNRSSVGAYDTARSGITLSLRSAF